MYKEYDENTEKRKGNKYEEIMQELAKDCGILIAKYAPTLHKACYDDNSGVTLSHLRMVRAIQQDCIRVYTDAAHKITFSGKGEEEVIEEMLDHDYDEADFDHDQGRKDKSLLTFTDPEWSLFGIPELLQNGKVDPGPVGSTRTRFCKCCDEQICISTELGR